MKKIRAAVVGYGNIGKYALEALQTAPDFEVAGIVRRNGAENKPAELAQYDVVKDIRELKDVDVAILATPTRSCEEYAWKVWVRSTFHPGHRCWKSLREMDGDIYEKLKADKNFFPYFKEKYGVELPPLD